MHLIYYCLMQNCVSVCYCHRDCFGRGQCCRGRVKNQSKNTETLGKRKKFFPEKKSARLAYKWHAMAHQALEKKKLKIKTKRPVGARTSNMTTITTRGCRAYFLCFFFHCPTTDAPPPRYSNWNTTPSSICMFFHLFFFGAAI